MTLLSTLTIQIAFYLSILGKRRAYRIELSVLGREQLNGRSPEDQLIVFLVTDLVVKTEFRALGWFPSDCHEQGVINSRSS